MHLCTEAYRSKMVAGHIVSAVSNLQRSVADVGLYNCLIQPPPCAMDTATPDGWTMRGSSPQSLWHLGLGTMRQWGL